MRAYKREEAWELDLRFWKTKEKKRFLSLKNKGNEGSSTAFSHPPIYAPETNTRASEPQGCCREKHNKVGTGWDRRVDLVAECTCQTEPIHAMPCRTGEKMWVCCFMCAGGGGRSGLVTDCMVRINGEIIADKEDF